MANNKVQLVIDVFSKAASSNLAKVGTSLAGFVSAAYLAAKAADTLKSAFQAGLNAVDSYKNQVASTSAVILSFQNQSAETDIAEQYKLAVDYTKSLIPALQEIAEKTVVGAEEVTELNKQLVLQGQLLDATNKEQIDAVKNIANAFGVMVGDVSQIRTEMTALFSGQANADSKLANFAKSRVSNLKEQVELWKEQGTLVENLGNLFAGFGPASDDLANTLGSIKSTLRSTANDVLARAMLPIYEDIVGQAKSLNELVKEHRDSIVTGIVAGYIGVRRVTTGIYNSWKTITELPIVSTFIEIQRTIRDTELELLGLSGELLANLGQEKTFDEEIEEVLADIKKHYGDSADSTDAIKNNLQGLQGNLKKPKTEAEDLKKEFDKIKDSLKFIIDTEGLTDYQKELAGISKTYDELVAKFGQRDLIDSAYYVKQADVIKSALKDSISAYSDQLKESIESEKTELNDRLSSYQSYYDNLVSQSNTALDKIKSKVQEVRDLEDLLSDSRSNTASLTTELLSKNTSDYQSFYATQEALEKELERISELSGRTKVEALQEYQKTVKNTAQEYKTGNIVIRSESDSTRDAIKKIEEAQKLIDDEIQKTISSKQQEINQTATWRDQLVSAAAAVKESIVGINYDVNLLTQEFDSLTTKVTQLYSQLDETKSVDININNALDKVDELRNYINANLSEEKISSDFTLSAFTLNSPKKPFSKGIEDMRKQLETLPASGEHTTTVSGGSRGSTANNITVNVNVSGTIDTNNSKQIARRLARDMQSELDRLSKIRT